MNDGKDVKIGYDKRQVPVIPNSEVPLYDLFSGEVLTDQFGVELITEVDQFYIPPAILSENSVPITFATKVSKLQIEEVIDVGIKTATYSGTNINRIGINTQSLLVGDIIIAPSLPEGTSITRVGIGSIYVSNFSINSTSPKTEGVSIKRRQSTFIKSDPVLKVGEQFPELSEVSTTLLGITREERQLSLFANVSSYGLDPDDFEFYTYNGGPRTFGTWEARRNETYGNRSQQRLDEETQESGIKISIFTTPYSYPFGPTFDKYGLYNSTLFPLYLQFIRTGNDLYNYFVTGPGASLGYPPDWKNNFLSPSLATTVGSGANEDVEYVAGFSTAFAQIDTWTETWRKIKNPTAGNQLIDPVTGATVGQSYVSAISPGYSNSGTRGGYTTSRKRFIQLQSRRIFRYQPGRISGFTFGVRSSREFVDGIILEWGIQNPTDQYVFRMYQGNLFIVRRSTVKLDDDILIRNGLSVNDQVLETSGDPYDSTQYWTLKIRQDFFNGDTLRGTGDSVHLLQTEKVTMYKIEFGWYGAIGARFYAYVPVGNGEARWVVVHTLVIENQLGRPCLQDSYFRFKYSIDCFDTEDISAPNYIYKYGASYYIDGGDEGPFTNYSVSSGQKDLFSKNSGKSTSLIGVLPKDFILNSVGKQIQNKKIIVPTELTVTSDSSAEIKIVKCTACPGFGHVYTPGIATTESGRSVEIEFFDNNTVEAINNTYFYEGDVGAKLIAPSIYDAYITDVFEESTDPAAPAGAYQKATIKGVAGNNRNIPQSKVLDRVVGIATTIFVGNPYPYPVRLSNYSYAASDFKFTGSKIEIQFVNRVTNDDYSHFADFLVGITDVPPVVSDSPTPQRLEGFTVGGATTTVLPNSSILFGEHKHEEIGLTENGVENGEVDIDGDFYMEMDRRVRVIPNPGGGYCSKATITVSQTQEITGVTELNAHPQTGVAGFYVEKAGTFPSLNYDNGQVTIKSGTTITPTSSKFVGIVSSYPKTVGGVPVTYSFIQISNTLNRVGAGQFSLAVRPLRITGTSVDATKIFNYNPYPLYLIFKLRDNAQVNNISVKETTADKVRTITPKLYVDSNVGITTAGDADREGTPATNFVEINRLSSATVDTQNYQPLRPYSEKDTVYVGPNQVNKIDLKRTFGVDRNVISANVDNTEATFIIARKTDAGAGGTIEATLNFKEQ